MLEIVRPKKTKNYLSTIAMGDEYFYQWQTSAMPMWLEYCEKYDLGLLVFTDELIEKEHPSYKKPTWQKLLIPSELDNIGYDAENICYLDTDILISPIAKNVFDYHVPSSIGVVSQRHSLPMNLELTLRILAFSRNRYFSESYPLDSALFMKPERIFSEHDLKLGVDEYFCAGMFLYNVENYKNFFTELFYKYPAGIQSMTGGGDEPLVNYEFLKNGELNFLPYEFQALWIYEIAHKYPFLFNKIQDEELVKECVQASLLSNSFLHFAGSWNESQLWKIGDFFKDSSSADWIDKFSEYLETELTGDPKGMMRP